jgi:hypothetical protein
LTLPGALTEAGQNLIQRRLMHAFGKSPLALN